MWLSALLPWRRFALPTAWSPAEAERELARVLDGPASNEEGAWHGSRSVGRFLVRRRIGRTTVVASGKVAAAANGSQVAVTLRLPVETLVLLLVAVPFVAVLSVAVSVAAIVRDEGAALLIWVLPFTVWPGIVRPFLLEARAAESFFRSFFPPPPPPSEGPFR